MFGKKSEFIEAKCSMSYKMRQLDHTNPTLSNLITFGAWKGILMEKK
jgi:hypothetical protein